MKYKKQSWEGGFLHNTGEYEKIKKIKIDFWGVYRSIQSNSVSLLVYNKYGFLSSFFLVHSFFILCSNLNIKILNFVIKMKGVDYIPLLLFYTNPFFIIARAY